MQIGRVIGNVVRTIKNDPLEGKKLLLVQLLDENGSDHGKPLVAIDAVGAGRVRTCIGAEAERLRCPGIRTKKFQRKQRLWES